jgi:hypothetical protein
MTSFVSPSGVGQNKQMAIDRAAEIRAKRNSGDITPAVAYQRLQDLGQATSEDKPALETEIGQAPGPQMQSAPTEAAVAKQAAETRIEPDVRTALGSAGPTWAPASVSARNVLGQEEAKALLASLVTTARISQWRAEVDEPKTKPERSAASSSAASEGVTTTSNAPPKAAKLGLPLLNLNMVVSTPGDGPHELEQYGVVTMLREFVTELHRYKQLGKPQLVVQDAFDLVLETTDGNAKPLEIYKRVLDAAKGGALLLSRAHAAPKTFLLMMNEALKRDPHAFTVFLGGPKAQITEAMRSVPGSNFEALVYRDLPITPLSAKDVATRMREIASSEYKLVAKPAAWSQAAYLFVNKAQAPGVGIDDAITRFVGDGYERMCGRLAAKPERACASRLPFFQSARATLLTLDDLLGASRPNIEAIKKLIAEHSNTPQLQAYFQKLYNGASIIDRVNRTKKDGEPLAQLNKLFTAGVLLSGPKGTGKSTAVDAIALANYHARLTVDPKPIIKVPADLKKGYLGQSGQAALALLQEIMGKTLFMDEFHNLITSPQDTYGIEVSAVLMWGREFYRDRFAMAAAGYPGPLARLFGFEQGWSSRFPFRVNIEKWSAEKATEIFPKKVEEQNLGIEVPQETIDAFHEEAKGLAEEDWWGSGRDTRTIADEAVMAMSERIAASGNPNVPLRLEPEDVRYAVQQLRSGRSMDELDDGAGPDVAGGHNAMTEEETAQAMNSIVKTKDQLEALYGPWLRAEMEKLFAQKGFGGPEMHQPLEA